MNRRTLLQSLAALAALPLLPACSKASSGLESAASPPMTSAGAGSSAVSSGAGAALEEVKRLDHPHAFWRDKVSPAAYEVLFDEDTEAAFSSPLDKEKRPGTFVCAACQLPLFDSTAKFDSGTGWPSFTAPIAGHMGTKRDFKLIWPRTEYHCARCGGHQGHVFDDGPAPRGERWCNNGLALAFVPQGQPLPALRG
jgi:peptide-methionine (R)-S-oxide reductase